jgi:ABC-type uncharacterized transport system ATPase subunit
VERTRSYATFVVRVSRDDANGVSGVVICVRSGERLAFRGVDGAGRVLAQAIARETQPRGEGAISPEA